MFQTCMTTTPKVQKKPRMNRNLNVIITSSSLELLSIYLSVIFANWLLLILKMFHFNLAFALWYTGNKPPQALNDCGCQILRVKISQSALFS